MSFVTWEIKDVLDALVAQNVKLDAILSREAELAKTLAELTADFAAARDAIKADAADVKAAVAAVLALLNGVVAVNAAMKQKIADLIALSPTPEQLAALEDIQKDLVTQDVDLDASVKTLNDGTAANTAA